MNPREAALLHASAILLAQSRDTAYGPAHAVADALELEFEVATQIQSAIQKNVGANIETMRKAGAL